MNQLYDIIDTVASIIFNANRAKGFYDDEPFQTVSGMASIEEDCLHQKRIYLGNKIALMHGELSELHEAIRKDIKVSEHIPEFSAIEEEVADTIIRLLDFAGYNELRLAQAIKAKLIYNQSRPYKHGKKF